jgi:hypothetical protein
MSSRGKTDAIDAEVADRAMRCVSSRSGRIIRNTTVINIRTQAVGRTPGADVLASLATSVLFGLD